MSWTSSADLRAQVMRLWERGLLLGGLVEGESPFPRRLILKSPSSSELAERFDEVRAWINELRQARHCRVTMREVRHRTLGANAIPDEAWIDTLDDALALIGKTREARRYAELVALSRERQPKLLPWLARYPLKALELAEEWPRLLDVVGWLQVHPRPGVYLRQIDLPGIHTKFIEAHRATLNAMLDLALPAASIEPEAGGSFCRRYGFKDKPQRVRFRVLDPAHALLAVAADQDVALNSEAFAQLKLAISRVFITENETNFLAFPALPASLAIFGAGYGFETLAPAPWLRRCAVHYWGDIDTHGFAILDQLRAVLPHARSFLMDRETLMAHRALWGVEPKPERRDLFRLDREERALYDDLRDNRLGRNLRLEQERIGFGWVEAAAQALLQPKPAHGPLGLR
jgi:hypothetical protein